MTAAKKLQNLEDLSPFEYRTLGSTDLRVSPICFGSLRLTPENEMYKESLRVALSNGVNFIDSSGGYGDGASELLIGDVLQEQSLMGELQRDQIVISTKIGTLHGRALADAVKRETFGHPFPGLTWINNQLAHCMSPDYLEHQITTSLRRLNLSHVDIVYLQSPEMMLNQGYSKDQMMAALKKAFEHLEVEVVKGRVRYYGLASSALLKKDIASDHLDLKDVYELANSIRPNHRFAAIQVPFNLFETQAYMETNQKGQSLFKTAKDLGLATVTCRPLTSHHRNKLHHFITFPERDETSIKGKLHQTLLELVAMEKDLQQQLPAYPALNWGHSLKENLESICDLWKWTQYVQKHMRPKCQESLSQLPLESQWDIWRNKYTQKLNLVSRLVTESLESISNLRTNQISHFLDTKTSSLGTKKLSNKVTQLYMSFEEIDSIIMGLGSPEYVKDLLQIQTIPSKEETLQVLKDIRLHF